jgi:hypothetical protein
MVNNESNGWTRRSLLRGMAIAGVAPLLPGIAVAAPGQDGLAEDGFTLVQDGVAAALFVVPRVTWPPTWNGSAACGHPCAAPRPGWPGPRC